MITKVHFIIFWGQVYYYIGDDGKLVIHQRGVGEEYLLNRGARQNDLFFVLIFGYCLFQSESGRGMFLIETSNRWFQSVWLLVRLIRSIGNGYRVLTD